MSYCSEQLDSKLLNVKIANSYDKEIEYNATANKKLINNKLTKYRQHLSGLLVIIHFMSCGIMTAFSSVLVTQLQENNELEITTEQATWIASIYILPMAPVAILTGMAVSKVRKRTILFTITILEIVGWFTIYYFATRSVLGIMAGRLIIGIPHAMGAPILPSFLGEVTHPKLRALYLSFGSVGLSTGILLTHLMAAFLNWSTCIFIHSSFALVFFAISCYLQESHVWYLRHNETYKAKEAFHWYRGHEDEAKQEIARLIAKQEENVTSNQTNWEFMKLCCSRLFLMPVFITVTLMITMHLSGYKVIVFYSISMMKSVIPSLNKYMSTVIVDVIRLVANIFGSYLLKKMKVRPIMLISGYGSAAAHFLFAIFKFASPKPTGDINLFSILSLVALVSYITFASLGLSSLPWVIAGEIFPLSIKGVASGISMCSYFTVFFLVIKFMPLLEVSFGVGFEFLFFGCCTCLGITIMYFVMPETKNKTLKEIEDLFRKKT